jgi:hypothetical protein
MEENDEIKKDREALNEYLKRDSTEDFMKFAKEFAKKVGIENPKAFTKTIDDESKFKIDYEPMKNHFGLKTPARINVNREKGTIEIPKSMFDKKNPEYHRQRLKIFSVMTVFEVGQIEGNIIHKVELTNKRIREWFDYTVKELKQHFESKKFLEDLGEEVNTDWLAIGIVARLKYNLIRKFWWRMGWFGIKQRIKLLIKQK